MIDLTEESVDSCMSSAFSQSLLKNLTIIFILVIIKFLPRIDVEHVQAFLGTWLGVNHQGHWLVQLIEQWQRWP